MVLNTSLIHQTVVVLFAKPILSFSVPDSTIDGATFAKIGPNIVADSAENRPVDASREPLGRCGYRLNPSGHCRAIRQNFLLIPAQILRRLVL